MLENYIIFLLYFSFFVFVLGIFGNILCIKIYLSKRFRKNPTFFLYVIKIIFDCFIQFYSTYEFIKYITNFDLLIKSIILCKAGHYSLHISTSTSAWILALISIDNLTKTRYPSKTINSKHIYLILMSFIILTEIGYNSPLAIYMEILNHTNTSECMYTKELEFYTWMDLFNSNVGPFMVMGLSSILTINTLFKSKAKMKKKNNRDYKYAITSIALNVTFFILGLPSTILFLICVSIDLDPGLYDFFNVLTNMILYANFGMLFYVSFFFNSMFRKEFNLLIKKNKVSKSNFTLTAHNKSYAT